MAKGVRAIECIALTPEVFVTRDPSGEYPPTSTLWSGAVAFRTRWTADRTSPLWTAEGCPGSHDAGGDVFRFDPSTRVLRETWLTRPTSLCVDAARLDAIARAPLCTGTIAMPEATPDFVVPIATVGLFDLSLACYAALVADPDGALPPSDVPWRAVPISPHLALLLLGGRYVGWRVIDPVSHARPMGWPEPRVGTPPEGEVRERLAALLYDWMTLDAAPRVRPDEAMDPDDIAHLVALRDRARALAELSTHDGDPTPGVARDIAAHIQWGWGFFRLGEGTPTP